MKRDDLLPVMAHLHRAIHEMEVACKILRSNNYDLAAGELDKLKWAVVNGAQKMAVLYETPQDESS